jgi:exopolysaccharide biosynthesis protein
MRHGFFGVEALGFVFAILFAASAHADWTVVSSRSEKSVPLGAENRHIVLTEKETGTETTLDLALFSMKSTTLRVIDNAGGRDDLAIVAAREHALAGTNGGYFDPENQPVGLVVIDGRQMAPLRRARLLSGVLLAADGRIQLLRTAEFSTKRKATAALQCGPFLVDHAKPVAGLNATREARRTFIARSGSDQVVLGFCSEATLAGLAGILVGSVVPDLKFDRALNLDGGSSSAYWFNGSHGAFSISEQKTVRNFVVAIQRKDFNHE